MLDKLDDETVIDLAEHPQETFRNVFILRKYRISKANPEFNKQNSRKILSNQGPNF